MEKKKIVFLYSELAGYFMACIKKLAQCNAVKIHVIHWPINKEAPFHFVPSDEITLYNRNEYTDSELQKLVESIQPSVLYCSGWMDKGYLNVSKYYKNNIPVIVGFDNAWKGTLRQWLAVLISPFKIRNRFSHCWIPGQPQYRYAKRLGFSDRHILKGFYCCDVDFFNARYEASKNAKRNEFPKRFIYVGRYVAHKGIHELWEAFIQLQHEQPNEWELWCLGTGDVEPVQHQKIKHFGFVQPSEMNGFIEKTGVFVLPSHFEPWGVVIHEFATAGFPIISSDQVGARTIFVENNLNGYIYPSGNKEELKSAMARMINSDKEELNSMSQESIKRASLITPDLWVKQLIALL